MADKYSTIQQHQPLRVPAGWDKQEKAFVVQLEEILDDLYRRFGRLSEKDFGKSFRNTIQDIDGNMAEIRQDINDIELSVADKYDKVSGIAIESAGVGVTGSKYVKVYSGCELDIESGGNMNINNGADLNIKSGGDLDIESGANLNILSGGDLEIKSGGTITVAGGNFGIDANGNATFKGGGTFSGALSAATGTFAGTMSAACITSGTMSADRISGGTIDASSTTVKNLDASKITTGTMSANKISGGSIDASNVTITNLNASNISSGTMSASKISGGTLTVGGSGNGSGQIIINNSSGTEIGRIDNAGYAVKGDMNITGSGAIKIKSGSSTTMQLDTTGINMSTAGKFFLHASDSSNSAIIFGSDKSSANFYVGQSGDVVTKSLVTDDLSVGGYPIPNFVVSASEPSGHNIIWLQPSSNTSKQWGFRPSSLVLDNAGGTLGYYKDFTCSYASSDYMAGALYYGIVARFYFYNLSTYSSRTFKARLKNGSSWIDLGSVTDFVQTGRTLKLDSMLTSTNTNVMSASGGNFTIRLESNAPSGEAMLLNEDITFKAASSSSSGLSACTVYYKS